MPPRSNQDRRTNGFQAPFTAAQVATWIALPVLVIEFLLFVSPILPLGASIPCTIVFIVTAVLSAYYAALATKIDPLDDYLAKHLKKTENGDGEGEDNGFGGCLGNPGEETEPLKHCWICETQVAEHAMHCKFCNKCVGKFDHHCMCKYKQASKCRGDVYDYSYCCFSFFHWQSLSIFLEFLLHSLRRA